jgi:16S rRNA (cytidine1402-2'-O)-methyltransferase
MTETQATGTLYIIATPIGHLDDITLRALDLLKSVDYILAEDTRHSRQLLTSLGIKNKLHAFHAHNEGEKSAYFIEQLLSGKQIALISDAGTPLISDPGFPLVRLARAQHIPVVPIPGASAVITALSAAGVPCDSFLFLGFLPAKHSARVNKLTAISQEPYTLVLYESTHRIIDCLTDIHEVFGAACPLVLAKELTKTHERFIEGTAIEIISWLQSDMRHIKGEFVLIIPERPLKPHHQQGEALLKVLLKELPLKHAVSIASQLVDTHKNELYELALRMKKG